MIESELEVFRAAYRQRMQEREALRVARLTHAWELARQAAQILKTEFGASRVVVFGSLLHPKLFHQRSDVDLAVWDVQHYFRAVTRLIDLEPGFDFDLVPVEDARPGVLETIEREGIDL
jgi:predicted nucleotidyltransferase